MNTTETTHEFMQAGDADAAPVAFFKAGSGAKRKKARGVGASD
jgi:hypothetical protein